MLFDGWAGIARIAVVGVLAYLALLVLIRLIGKRGLTKMTPFDYIGTVAIGSTLANTLLSKDIVLAEGVTGFVVLLAVQWVISWFSVRYSALDRVVNPEPTLLLLRGRLLHDVMQRLRVTEEEMLASVRSHGFARLEDVDAVVSSRTGASQSSGAGATRVRPWPMCQDPEVWCTAGSGRSVPNLNPDPIHSGWRRSNARQVVAPRQSNGTCPAAQDVWGKAAQGWPLPPAEP